MSNWAESFFIKVVILFALILTKHGIGMRENGSYIRGQWSVSSI